MKETLLWLFGLNPADVQHVSSVSLQFRNFEALGWLVFLLMLLGGFTWWTYFIQEPHRALPITQKRVLAGLRFSLLALIVLLLLRPVLALDLEQQIRRTVLVLIDNTKSMNLRDQRIDEIDCKRAEIGLGAISKLSQPLDSARAAEARQISRADLVKAVFQNKSLDLIASLKRDFNVEPFLFGRTAAPADPAWLRTYAPSVNSTAIGDTLRDILERKRGQPLAGIVLVSDGGNNAGSPPAEAAEEAGREGVPIYAYGVGITSPRDIVVSHLSVPEIAFANDQVQVTVQVHGQSLAGQTGHLTLKLGNEEVASKDVTFSGGDDIVSLEFTPHTKGTFDLTASIPPRDDEVSKENNSTRQHIRVIDDKIKVLYIEQTPRWEFRFLQQVLLRDRRIQASFVLLDGDPAITQNPPYLPKFPDDKTQLFKYDMVIVGDVDPKTFSSAQLNALGEFVSKFGGSVLFIAGRNNMPESYRGTIVEKMLPVDLDPFRNSDSDDTQPIHLTLTPLGLDSQMLRLTPDEDANSDLWSKLPPVYWDFRVANPKPAAQVLVADADPAKASRFGPMPVLATQQYGVGQIFYLGTDELWRWRRDEGVNEYPLLWGQIVQGAALAHLLGGSKKTQLSIDKVDHNVGDPVTAFARLYDDSFQPITDSQVMATCTVQESGTTGTMRVMFRNVAGYPGMYRADFVALQAGQYHLSTLSDPATAIEFTASEPQFELGDTAMDEALLKQIAAISGGRFFREEDLSELASSFNRKPETLHRALDIELWSSPFYFILLCAVAVSEWLLRKRWHLK